MKYLRKFNESIKQYQDDVDAFIALTNDSLAYLIDEGVKLNINKDKHSKLVGGGIALYVEIDLPYLNWDEIKDYFIPYVEMVNTNYEFRLSKVKGDDVAIIFMTKNLDDIRKFTSYNINNIITDNMGVLNEHEECIYNIYFDVIFK